VFVDFFFTLKKYKVPVSITEWMTLMQALSQGHGGASLTGFYYLSRALLVKSEAFFDHFDRAFADFFEGIETPDEITQEILDWLKDPINPLMLSDEELASLEKLSLEELRKLFEERLREQTERHDGGGRWIGTGGTSPFGHSGSHPSGIRVGGEGGGGRAIQVAAERRFKNYRTDVTLDVRQIKVALKKLRFFKNEGPEDELDLDETIDKTCKNGGEIELVFGRERKNAVKLLLLMDSGGSMEPFAHLVNRLFSAAHSSQHFKDFKAYYFHNCVYDFVYEDMWNREAIPTTTLLKNIDGDYKLIMVGDAHMAPYELFAEGGIIDYYTHNDAPGMEWLQRVADHFRYSVWLNPINPRMWIHPTIRAIGKVFPMFELTVSGLEDAVKKLMVRK
jgi:uncharacterized protein with von Willebrand factor type A (vWA) domain